MNDLLPLHEFFKGLTVLDASSHRGVHIILDNARTHQIIETMYPPPPPTVMRIDTPPAHRSIRAAPVVTPGTIPSDRKPPRSHVQTRNITVARKIPSLPRQTLSDSNLRTSRWETGGAVFSPTARPVDKRFGISYTTGRNAMINSPTLLRNERWEDQKKSIATMTTGNRSAVSILMLNRSWDHFDIHSLSSDGDLSPFKGGPVEPLRETLGTVNERYHPQENPFIEAAMSA